eukprot:5510918-Amphidinium_carterae.2
MSRGCRRGGGVGRGLGCRRGLRLCLVPPTRGGRSGSMCLSGRSACGCASGSLCPGPPKGCVAVRLTSGLGRQDMVVSAWLL